MLISALSTDRAVLLHGDSTEIRTIIPAGFVDSIVTDPPAGIGFMAKGWDGDKGGRDQWVAWLREIMRASWEALKPGGYGVAWALPRTSHWTMLAIEDAGFEIRDVIVHLYGSGFPKSLDVSKELDKRDAVAKRRDRALAFTAWIRSTGLSAADIDRITGTQMGSHFTSSNSQPYVATRDHLDMLRPHFAVAVPEWIEKLCDERTVESATFKSREVIGVATQPDTSKVRPGFAGEIFGGAGETREVPITAPLTAEARAWKGWGTALKPAAEHWILFRKPPIGNIADNLLEHGTGAINIDGCRIDAPDAPDAPAISLAAGSRYVGVFNGGVSSGHEPRVTSASSKGRWPANLILSHGDECAIVDGSLVCGADCPIRMIDEQADELPGKGPSRFFYCAKPPRSEKDAGVQREAASGGAATDRKDGSAGLNSPRAGAGRRGGAKNTHPTVKGVGLMRYLVRLVTRPGGTVLDPFAGSATTGVAAIAEGMSFIGCELAEDHAEYIEIGRDRLISALAGDAEE